METVNRTRNSNPEKKILAAIILFKKKYDDKKSMQYTSHKFGHYLMTPNFSQKYSRTTAEGRHIWSSIESLRLVLRRLMGAVDEKMFRETETWPDIIPSSEAARTLIEALGHRPLPVLQLME